MTTPLWIIRFFASPAEAPLIEGAFEEDCLSVTTLEPDEKGVTRVEIMVAFEPKSGVIDAKMVHLGIKNVRFEVESVGNLDWIRAVSAQLEPFSVAKWTIFGSNFREKVSPNALNLEINATSAFGTGEHPTTRGCLLMLAEILDKQQPKGWHLLDMGCGSAILAMAFARATGGRALGIDMDAQSVEIARENVIANGLENLIKIEEGEGYANPLIKQNGPYDLIMANVFADPICEMAPDLASNLKPNGLAILSGMLVSQADSVLSAHSAQGLHLLKRMDLGEWSVLALCRPAVAS